MKRAIHSLILAFSELRKWQNIKIILLSGVLTTVIWSIIGYFSWDYLVDFSSHILEYIPFSMIRANGAKMLSFFLWFELVLITFALIYAFFGNFILRSVKKERYSSFTFITIALSAIFWAVVWFFSGDFIYRQFLKLLTWLPFETIEKGVSFLIALYIIYAAIIVTLLVFTSILSEPLIKGIRARDFKENEVVKTNIFASIRYTIKDSLIFIFLSILAFPLIFVPILNLLVQVVLWIWLYKDTISHDGLYLSSKNPDPNLLKEHRLPIYFISFVSVLLNFLPVLNIFSPFLAEIAIYYYIKGVD